MADRVAACRKCTRNVLDEVLLTPAGGLDRRRLLDSLGAAATKEGNATEHRAEDNHGELLCARSQPIFPFFHAIVCADARSVCCSISFCSSFPRRKVLSSVGLTYVVRADLAEHGELVVDGHICGWYVWLRLWLADEIDVEDAAGINSEVGISRQHLSPRGGGIAGRHAVTPSCPDLRVSLSRWSDSSNLYKIPTHDNHMQSPGPVLPKAFIRSLGQFTSEANLGFKGKVMLLARSAA